MVPPAFWIPIRALPPFQEPQIGLSSTYTSMIFVVSYSTICWVVISELHDNGGCYQSLQQRFCRVVTQDCVPNITCHRRIYIMVCSVNELRGTPVELRMTEKTANHYCSANDKSNVSTPFAPTIMELWALQKNKSQRGGITLLHVSSSPIKISSMIKGKGGA